MIVENGKNGMKGYAIRLATEKRSKVSNNRSIQKCWYDRIKVFPSVLLLGLMTCFYEEEEEKAKYGSEERKIIVLWNKESVEEFPYLPRTEVYEDKLLSDPFCEYIPESGEKKYRKGERNNRRKDRFCQSFFPGKLMEEDNKNEPGNCHNHPEGEYFYTKNLNNGIHGRKLGIKPNTPKYYFAYSTTRFSRKSIIFTSPG